MKYIPFATVITLLLSRCSPFNLDTIAVDTLEPSLKPSFLINATQDIVDQFIGIARTQGLTQHRKALELDVLIGTLRPEVQASFSTYKAEALMLRLDQDERYMGVVAKTHYVIAHMQALKDSKTIGDSEKKKRTEMIFAEFSSFVVDSVTEEVGNVVENTMRMMLRAILFTEKWGL